MRTFENFNLLSVNHNFHQKYKVISKENSNMLEMQNKMSANFVVHVALTILHIVKRRQKHSRPKTVNNNFAGMLWIKK